MFRLELHFLIILGYLILLVSVVSGQTCGSSISFNCSQITSDGFCQALSNATVPQVNRTTTGKSSRNKVSFTNSTFLMPRTGRQCWNDATGSQCCANPCEANPCKNGGTCSNSSKPNELFTCSCQAGFTGDWCQNGSALFGMSAPETSTPETTTPTTTRQTIRPIGTKICLNCDTNAKCTNGKCVCKPGFLGDGTFCTAYCSALNITLPKNNSKCGGILITFNRSFEGKTQHSTQKCGDRALATVVCQIGTTAFDQSTLVCLPCNETLDTLLSSATNLVMLNQVTVPEIENYLKEIVVLSTATNKSADEVKKTTLFLAGLARDLTSGNVDTMNGTIKEITPDAMRNVITILEDTTSSLKPTSTVTPTQGSLDKVPSQTEEEKATRAAAADNDKIMDNFARSMSLPNASDTIKIITSKTTLQVTKPSKQADKTFNGVYFDAVMFESLSSNGSKIIPRKKPAVQMRIPSETVGHMDSLLDKKKGHELKLVFTVYESASHLTQDPRTGPVVQATFRPHAANKTSKKFKNDFTISHQSPPLPTEGQEKVTLGTNLKLHLEYFCVFWDFETSKWSQEGCTVSNTTAPGSSKLNYTCTCNHFTSFALLLRVTTNLKDYKQDYYSSILCGISAVFLILTIFIYVVVKELRIRRPTPIMVNICGNLAFGFILFLAGMDGRLRGFSNNACYAVTVLMHLAFLCCWFWMLIYSLNMYYALVQVVVGKTPLVAKKPFMYVMGYMVPMLIVMIDLAVSITQDKKPKQIEAKTFESHYIASHICWLRSLSMYLGFATPIGVILFINIVIFFLVIRKLTWKKTVVQSSKEKTTTTQQVFMAVAMCSTMGLTWIFGYLMLISTDPAYQKVMEILFNISNTSQGIIIFFVSCVRQRKVRDLWMVKFFGCCGYKKKQEKSTTTLMTEGSASKVASPPLLKHEEVDTTGL